MLFGSCVEILLHDGHLLMMLILSFPCFIRQRRLLILQTMPSMPFWSRIAPEFIDFSTQSLHSNWAWHNCS